jgi:Holliday junction resolvase RusA-like endonuclease
MNLALGNTPLKLKSRSTQCAYYVRSNMFTLAHEIVSPWLNLVRSQKTYIIPGNPIPLLRARHGNGRVYDSQKHTRLSLQLLLKSQHNNARLYSGPLHLDIVFYFSPSGSEKRKSQLEDTFVLKKPDVSNLVKLIEDAATGILYSDDCLIVSELPVKIYSRNPRTEFRIVELKK